MFDKAVADEKNRKFVSVNFSGELLYLRYLEFTLEYTTLTERCETGSAAVTAEQILSPRIRRFSCNVTACSSTDFSRSDCCMTRKKIVVLILVRNILAYTFKAQCECPQLFWVSLWHVWVSCLAGIGWFSLVIEIQPQSCSMLTINMGGSQIHTFSRFTLFSSSICFTTFPHTVSILESHKNTWSHTIEKPLIFVFLHIGFILCCALMHSQCFLLSLTLDCWLILWSDQVCVDEMILQCWPHWWWR